MITVGTRARDVTDYLPIAQHRVELIGNDFVIEAVACE
jgi:hypothetical protein